MARHVIPNHYYNVPNWETIYFMPFDHNPVAEDSTATFNFGKVDNPRMSLVLKPGQYEATVIARRFNVMMSACGVYGLKYT